MAKPSRSPVLGYNHNVRYHGRVFHIQTEDSGPVNPRLYTHLFYAGTILSSKKHEYDPAAAEDAVKALMQKLHKAMIKELTHGVHDERIAVFFQMRGEPAVLEDPNAPAAQAPAAAAAAPVESRAVDARQVAVSGSIDTAAPRPPEPARAPAPAAPAPRPQVAPRPMVIVKPGELRRAPVVLSSSADGVVVQRNVVINVGGGAPPVNGERERPRPRAQAPYVVRDPGYTPAPSGRPTATGAPAAGQPQPLAAREPAAGPARDVRMPWDPPASRAVEAAVRARAPEVPSERTPSGRAFAADLVTDKSLDEVILEYLSDDAETETR